MEAPSIILITIDSLRSDHLGCYGYPRDTSPNMDDLASKGMLFLEAMSNGGQTSEAFPSILASALPPLDRTDGKMILQRRTTLAELLKQAGYHTGAFHSNPLLSRFYGYSKGFDIFDDSLSKSTLSRARLWTRTKPQSPNSLAVKVLDRLGRVFESVLARAATGPIVTAEEINKKAMSWLATIRGSFFLWLHYMDVHHPYTPSPQYLSQFCAERVSRATMSTLYEKILKKPDQLSPSEVEMLISLYDADIRHVDDSVGLLLRNIGNDLSNILVIMTADHGEEFGEHGKFSHLTLYDGLLHVPLIMAGPGIYSDTVVEQQVSLLDLAPTIAELAGVCNTNAFQGRSLLHTVKGERGAREGTISTFIDGLTGRRLIAYRTPRWKYIRTETLGDVNVVLAEELYDLSDDPTETRNLHGEGDEEGNRFELEAKGRIARFKQLKVEEAAGYEKQRIKARLSKLDKL